MLLTFLSYLVINSIVLCSLRLICIADYQADVWMVLLILPFSIFFLSPAMSSRHKTRFRSYEVGYR